MNRTMNASLFRPDGGRWRRRLARPAAAIGLCAAALLYGRTPMAANPSPAAPKVTAAADPFAALANAEKKLGKAEEDDGNLRTAAYHYEMVANLSSGPVKSEYTKKAAELRQESKRLGEREFKEGMAAYEKSEPAPAFRALLRSLAYDPGNQVALRTIKDDLIGTSVIPYTVVKGDTLATIAEKNKFEDPSEAWVIGTYNDLGANAQVRPGQVLKVPLMIGVLPRTAVAGAPGAPQEEADEEEAASDQYSATLDQARDLIKSSKFEDASKLADQVLAEDPINKDAREVRNQSNYSLGKRFAEQKQYEAALTAFRRVEPGYQDTRQQLTEVSRIDADEHYSKGVEYYTKDDLDDAIKEFETTLALNPDHPQAAKSLQEARATREKLRQLK